MTSSQREALRYALRRLNDVLADINHTDEGSTRLIGRFRFNEEKGFLAAEIEVTTGREIIGGED